MALPLLYISGGEDKDDALTTFEKPCYLWTVTNECKKMMAQKVDHKWIKPSSSKFYKKREAKLKIFLGSINKISEKISKKSGNQWTIKIRKIEVA